MKKILKILAYILLVILILALVAAGWYLYKAVPVGTGYVAKYMCTAAFVADRNPDAVFEEIKPINPLAYIISWEVNREDGIVTASALGKHDTALYRPDCGCTLARSATVKKLRQQSFFEHVKAQKLMERSTEPWPQGNGPVEAPALYGIDPQRLTKVIDAAFSEPYEDKERNTMAALVVYDGHLIAERYAPELSPDQPLLGWSMSKSVTNALVGVQVGKGWLSLDDRAPVPEWESGDPRHDITLDQLLRMSSGLDFQEVYQPLYDATNMLYKSADFAAYAAGKSPAYPPDSMFSYSSGTANIIARMVRHRAEEHYDHYYRFLYEDFFHRIGMTSVIFEPDPSGTFVGSSYCSATPRDWARFGQLYLQDGVWEGERILPEGWVRYSTTPTPTASRGQYGVLWWLNAGSPDNAEQRRWPDVPQDAFAAEGYLGQFVIVLPSKKLVLVRFGATVDFSAWSNNEFVKNIVEILPEG